jgi:small-conductance mechanosensitive channel
LIASWLIGLFTSGAHEDAISGDLLEEFSDLASKSGLPYARRWYWRQSIKTVGNLMGTGLRTAPWLIASTVIGGYLMLQLALGFALPELLIDAVIELRWHHVVPYYTQREMDAYMFWFGTAVMIGYLLVPLFVGCIVATVAKAREIIATVTLSVFLFARTVVAWFNLARHRPELPQLPIMALVGILLVLIGGVMVREVRRVARGRRSNLAAP